MKGGGGEDSCYNSPNRITSPSYSWKWQVFSVSVKYWGKVCIVLIWIRINSLFQIWHFTRQLCYSLLSKNLIFSIIKKAIWILTQIARFNWPHELAGFPYWPYELSGELSKIGSGLALECPIGNKYGILRNVLFIRIWVRSTPHNSKPDFY